VLHVDRDLVPVDLKMGAIVLTAAAILGVGLVSGRDSLEEAFLELTRPTGLPGRMTLRVPWG
jgi:hypothetical protein